MIYIMKNDEEGFFFSQDITAGMTEHM